MALERLGQSLCERVQAGPAGLGAYHDELVSPQPCRDVGLAHASGDRSRRFAQDTVAGRVSLRVIDLLEPVEVEQHQAELVPVAQRTLPLAFQLLMERLPVGEAGE